jgi:membrane-associated phospholipid phosphatase
MRLESPTSLSRPSFSPDRTWPTTLALLVVSWTTLCAVVVGVGWLLVHPLAASVGELDDDLARWLAEHRTPVLNDLATVGAFAGDTRAGQIGLVAVALGFSLWQRSVVPALFVALVEAGLLGIYLVATYLISRPRPPVKVLDPALVTDDSFPSGHVATAVAIYGSIVVLTWTYGRAVRWWTTPLLVLPLCAVIARLYEGAHHLSDVLTSLAYATLWLATVTSVLLRSRSTPPDGRGVGR